MVGSSQYKGKINPFFGLPQNSLDLQGIINAPLRVLHTSVSKTGELLFQTAWQWPEVVV
jgi:hypothetical protein